MKGKGCLIAAAVVLVLITILAALVGPMVLREGGRIYRPIAKMQGAQKDFEAWSEEHPFKEPPAVTLSAEQLDRFMTLRRRLATIDEQNPLPVNGTRRRAPPKLSEVQTLLEGVGGNVTGRMEAYREVGMPAEEYRYLDRVIYRLWLRPLRAKGLDPVMAARVAKEVADLAASEKDAAVAGRLKRLAQGFSERRIPAPDGVPAEVHALLLARATDIDALIDVGAPLTGGRGGRARIDF